MTCADYRDLLPLHLYGDLSDSDRENVDAHLAVCAACRAELAALERTRAALNSAPVPTTSVDLNWIYRNESERQRRAARRWRIAALAGLAAAVLVLISRLDIRMDLRQITVRWGPAETAIAPPLPPVPPTII